MIELSNLTYRKNLAFLAINSMSGGQLNKKANANNKQLLTILERYATYAQSLQITFCNYKYAKLQHVDLRIV